MQMRREELRSELLSLLYTEYLHRGKELWFKARLLSKDIDPTTKQIGRICGNLLQDGLLCRHGTKRPSVWGTRFNGFKE